MELDEWMKLQKLTYKKRGDLIYINGWGKALVQNMEDRDHIFKTDKDGCTIFNTIEPFEYLKTDEIWYIVFPFGDCWYYIDIRDEKLTFHILKYVGKSPETEVKCGFYPLGIHTGYELLNGSGSLAVWADKAKFLGYKGIGICDKNTFAGSLDLQRECDKRGLKYCFGYSLVIAVGGDMVGAKIYVSSQNGFKNLLRIQKIINVDCEDDKVIEFTELLQYGDGNCIVFDKWTGQWCADHKDIVDEISKAFGGYIYFQVDISEYRADRIDSKMLDSVKSYFDNFYLGDGNYDCDLLPVLIQDMYYVDEDEKKNKIILNKIAYGTSHDVSDMQYMKTLDELFDEFDALFSEKYSEDVFYDMCQSTCDIAESCHASYDMGENYAPKYNLTKDEYLKYGDVHTMFNELLEEGFKELVPKGHEEEYRQRMEYEKYVIESTDNIDYFMITRDEINWAQKHGILTGIGRGSAGGCLILYLLHITNIDPIKWGLIFERFLLPERGGLSPEHVTKICDQRIQSNEYYTIKLENGKEYSFDKDAQFLVKRGEETISIYADELEEGDDIIFDNKDLVFTLNELNNENINN